MTTTKNGKATVSNIRDLKTAIEAQKPDAKFLKNQLLEGFAKDYARLDQIKAHKATLAKLQEMFDTAAKTASQWRKDLFEIEKAVAVAKSEAQLIVKEDAELNELHNALKAQGRSEEWKEYIHEVYVVPSVGAEKLEKLAHIKENGTRLVTQMEELKAAIESEKKALAELG